MIKSFITKDEYFNMVKKHKSTNASTPEFRKQELDAITAFPVGTKFAFKEDNSWHDMNTVYEKIDDDVWKITQVINGKVNDEYIKSDDEVRIYISDEFSGNAHPTSYVSGYGSINSSRRNKMIKSSKSQDDFEVIIDDYMDKWLETKDEVTNEEIKQHRKYLEEWVREIQERSVNSSRKQIKSSPDYHDYDHEYQDIHEEDIDDWLNSPKQEYRVDNKVILKAKGDSATRTVTEILDPSCELKVGDSVNDFSSNKDYLDDVYNGKFVIISTRRIKSAYTRPDSERFDKYGYFNPYTPTADELLKTDEIKKVLSEELSKVYEPDPMDNYAGYDSTNERIDTVIEEVAKQFNVDTDYVDELAGEVQHEEDDRLYEEAKWAEKNLKGDEYDKWYMGELDIRDRINSSRQIKSAVDGGWEVRSSDVPEALDLFVEYFGEETALEEIAKAMGDYTLRENLEWIAQQFGIAEDLEDSDTWDMYDEMLEIMGVSELFTNLTKAAGYDELAEDLAFIFRMNDFREWDKYD